MDLSEYQSLDTGAMVEAVRPGAALGIRYEVGTIGVIHCRRGSDGDTEREIRFTNSLAADFSFFEKRNWAVVGHCLCGRQVAREDFQRCRRCVKSMCVECLNAHSCPER